MISPNFAELRMLPFEKDAFFEVTMDCLEIPLKNWYLCERNNMRHSKFKKDAKMPFLFETWLSLYLSENKIEYVYYVNNLTRLVSFKKGIRP